MGIPDFFAHWFDQNFSAGHIHMRVDTYWADFNAMIHLIASYNWGYARNMTSEEKLAMLSVSETQQYQRFREMIEYSLEKRLEVFHPQKVYGIFIDGVPPRRKMDQQRFRRFRESGFTPAQTADLERKRTKTSTHYIIQKQGFDSTSISPGTPFMTWVEEILLAWIKRNRFRLPPTVYFSGSDVRGEGEHKILARMRTAEVQRMSGAHVLESGDTDILMLGIRSRLNNFFFVTPRTRRHTEALNPMSPDLALRIISVDLFKSELSKKYFVTHADDFVFLVYMIGNDFLPSVVSLESIEESLNTMLRIYVSMERRITNEEHIDWRVVRQFLVLLAQEEARLLAQVSVSTGANPIRALRESTQSVFRGTKYESVVDYPLFRYHWYDKLFPANPLLPVIDKGPLVADLCQRYLTGMSWNWLYYTGGAGLAGEDWAYPYYYAPLVSDLADWLTTNDAPPLEFGFQRNPERGPPQSVTPTRLTRCHQLLGILSPASWSVMPPGLLPVALDARLYHLYPLRFLVDPEGKTGKNPEHKYVCLVPLMDFDLLDVVLKEYLASLTEEQRASLPLADGKDYEDLQNRAVPVREVKLNNFRAPRNKDATSYYKGGTERGEQKPALEDYAENTRFVSRGGRGRGPSDRGRGSSFRGTSSERGRGSSFRGTSSGHPLDLPPSGHPLDAPRGGRQPGYAPRGSYSGNRGPSAPRSTYPSGHPLDLPRATAAPYIPRGPAPGGGFAPRGGLQLDRSASQAPQIL